MRMVIVVYYTRSSLGLLNYTFLAPNLNSVSEASSVVTHLLNEKVRLRPRYLFQSYIITVEYTCEEALCHLLNEKVGLELPY